MKTIVCPHCGDERAHPFPDWLRNWLANHIKQRHKDKEGT